VLKCLHACVLKSCAHASCSAVVCVHDVGCVKRASALRLSSLVAPFHSFSRRMCASGSASPVFPLSSLLGPHLSPRRSSPPLEPPRELGSFSLPSFVSFILDFFLRIPSTTQKKEDRKYILVRATNLLEDQSLNPEKPR